MPDEAGHSSGDQQAPTPDHPPDPRAAGRRELTRAALLGLAGAGLAAVAGHRTWVTVDAADAQARALADTLLADGSGIGSSPAAGAAALVALAAWGVLLVTRRRVRRGVAVLALLASLGVLAAVVVGWSAVPDAVRASLGPGSGVDVGRGPWLWLTALGGLGATAASVLAVPHVTRWPEMGTRYDAPAGGAGGAGAAGEPRPAADPDDEGASNLDLWRAIDQGQDPTATPRPEPGQPGRPG